MKRASWLWVVGSVVAHASEPDDAARVLADRAEAQLRRGQSMNAVEIAKACVGEYPDSDRCRQVWGRALAAQGRCGRALEELARVRPTRAWSGAAAVAEGLCHVVVGDVAAAIPALDEALFLRDNDAGAWVNRALAHARLGDVDALRDDLVAAPSTTPEPWIAEVLEAWAAYVGATDDDPDAAIWHLRTFGVPERTVQFHAAMLDCQRWLDLGDPEAAVAAAVVADAQGRPHAGVVACAAEARRRAGDPIRADILATRPAFLDRELPALDAVRARALVDLGDLDGAAALVATMPVDTLPEAVASAWYLARARGDAAAMARWARVHASFEPQVREDLDALVPLTAPEVP